MNETEAERVLRLRNEFLELHQKATAAAHAYFRECPVGPERIWASEVYDNVRTATRVPMGT